MITRTRRSKWAVAGALAALVLVAGTSVWAAEENSLGAFFRKLFKYPVKTTENVANTAGHAVSNTGGVAESAVRNTGAVVTGDIGKTGDIVAEPVSRTVNTAGALVSETAGAPVKAAEDVQKEE
jgi:hypothetical protein